MRNICLQTYRNKRRCLKLVYFLRKIQTLRVSNSRILMIKNAKLSGYYFYMNFNIWGDFQIWISVPLSTYFVRVVTCTNFFRKEKDEWTHWIFERAYRTFWRGLKKQNVFLWRIDNLNFIYTFKSHRVWFEKYKSGISK